jgi:hypothetical protein
MPKAFFIFFVNTLFCFSSFAQLLNNNIIVISESGKKFTLYVNGEKVNQQPEVNVKAFNLGEGWCKLKAEFEGGSPVISDSILIKAFVKNNNKEITYAIQEPSPNQKRTSGKFVFVSMGVLSGPQVPKLPDPPVDKDAFIDNNVYGNLYKAVNNKPVFFENYNDSTKNCSVELTDLDIKLGMNLVMKTNDFYNKYIYAEAAIEKNCYTTDQAMQLLKLLEIELDKLKLAKKAYWHLSDKANAPKIKSVFKYKSIEEDFDVFLKGVANAKYQEGLHCTVAISEDRLQDIIASIKKGRYEPDRLDIAREKTVSNCFITAQVEKLMQLFSHDREKMELAKSAYAVTIDKENYKLLEVNFLFSENKKEFMNFIEN